MISVERAEITVLEEAADRTTIDNGKTLRRLLGAALELERTALAKENELMATQCTAFEAEKKAMVEERKSIVQGLYRMIQIIQPNPFPTSAQPATFPASGAVLASVWSDDRAGGSVAKSIPSRKRARIESAPAAAASEDSTRSESTGRCYRSNLAGYFRGFQHPAFTVPIAPAGTRHCTFCAPAFAPSISWPRRTGNTRARSGISGSPQDHS
ncbi:hypothetical protein B0H13DRAFT_2459768 [Mycena leptocephala]|nr:hypothetical protein B0H13DRAFT_2459768 [Mycena leptocephala]